MAGTIPPIEPGLHLIATPIGAARDITLRALDILRSADVLAAEDTRSLRRLMALHGIEAGGRDIVAYHDHNGPRVRPRLLAALADGKSIAYAAEAGTPMIADPGYQLARAAIAEGHRVIAAPGPSAALAALTVSGLPSDRFLFAGFPPSQRSARRKFIDELAAIPATVILFESPRRVCETLTELADNWGESRQAALCRELTKRFETVWRGTLGELAASCAEQPPRGEVVLVVDRGRPDAHGHARAEVRMEEALVAELENRSLKEAVARVAEETGLPRRTVYQAALKLARGR